VATVCAGHGSHVLRWSRDRYDRADRAPQVAKRLSKPRARPCRPLLRPDQDRAPRPPARESAIGAAQRSQAC